MTQIGHDIADFALDIPGREGARIRLSWASATDIGLRRSINEDSSIAQAPIFAVADGMGGHSSGDLASDAVVSRLADVAVSHFLTPDQITEALVNATADIEKVTDTSMLGVGTTVTGAALALRGIDPCFALFNVGDSRTYLFEDGRLTQVTIDHSVVQEMVDAGILSAADAESHPDSNVITRAIGFGATPQPDFWMVPIRTGQRVLICSDGLTKEVGAEDLTGMLAAGASSLDTANSLVDAALKAGGRDNVTVVIVDVLEAPDDREFDEDIEDTAPRRN
ncbi:MULTISPECIES: protein phosphatase 2C domain-containing protein [unclassified Salinibacterium]|uniref:PP2C family protein-serine/threonine phosphatase n=1 Tax=unclassified Salinibacterium TaxID=2632331 RepID=UPI0014237DC1|nr:MULTISPECIES: protein phosphatase 2C domain-containing protein [unclassified Salinibacterium]